MTQEYEWEQSQSSNGAFFTGLVAGTLIGAGLGVLFAPRKGAELRGQVADSAATVGQTISKTVDTLTDQGRVVYDRARDVASRVGDVASRVGEVASRVGDQVNRATSDAARTVESTLNVVSDTTAGAARRAEKYAGRG